MIYQAVIWDCDGVLIDSEIIACTASAAQLVRLGYSITLDDYLLRFMGKNDRQMFTEIEAETGKDLRTLFSPEQSRAALFDAFTRDLKATPGIRHVLESLSCPTAIASGSGVQRLEHCLAITDLKKFFGAHVYSAEMVKNGKPAPDVYLLAAEKLGVDPGKCLAIEDGIHGLHSARAAGMDVCAYTGGSHMTATLEKNLRDAKPLAVFNDITELLPFLGVTKKLAFSA